jgi:plastocyanin
VRRLVTVLAAAALPAAVATTALAGGDGGDAPDARPVPAPHARPVQAPDARPIPARGARHAGAARTVTVGDNFFVHERGTPTVTVRRGDTVVFRFRGDSPHNVVVARGPRRFRSPARVSGAYRRTMRTPGSYAIVCTIHGAADQRMTLRVR